MTDITEEYLLKCSKCKKLQDIKKLKLGNKSIKKLDKDLFKQLSNLEDIDLSQNKLTTLPRGLNWKKLQILALEDNELEDIEFVGEFPNLCDLYIEGNDKLRKYGGYIAVYLCPKLQCLDDKDVFYMRKQVTNTKDKVEMEVKGIWEGGFADHYRDRIPAQELEPLEKNFLETLSKHDFDTMHDTSKEYQNFVKHSLGRELISSVQKQTYESPSKRSRVRKVPAKFSDLFISEKQSQPKQDKHNKIQESEIDWSSSDEDGTTFTSLKKKKSKPAAKRIKLDPAPTGNLPKAPDYDPVHFLRCHSKDNSPSDSKTTIWCCQFEPNLEKTGETTNIVATCGGNSVCLIDVSTGKVMKKYHHTKEELFVLSWTTIKMEVEKHKRRTNILAVAGYTRDDTIKLIDPDQNICYAELKGHTKSFKQQINALVFHKDHPTFLFSGAKGEILLWDIGIPEFPDFKVKYSILRSFSHTGDETLNLSLCMNQTVLIAGCALGCHFWNLKEKYFTPLKSSEKSKQSAGKAVLFPSCDSDVSCESVTLLSDTLLATRCYEENTIQVWDVPTVTTIAMGKKRLKTLTMKAELEWVDTDEPYINMSFQKSLGLLAAGDDAGNIRLYNLKWLLGNTESDELFEPSRILPWPECEVDKSNSLDVQLNNLKVDPLLVVSTGFNSNGEYLVAGTNNNMVCVWKKNKSS
ncbi:unnamed protein product [Owenia fusiformis]|uniref:Uncharacterized protein n=1 Tax=Owenia fusiformis TaxID=6347 RepID=A0A8J1YC09_OWEFU|nr:unnamed protein product [Owenia fusiformis]